MRIGQKNGKIATILNKEFVISIQFFEIMETIPTFMLSQQFLVWVAKKLFA